MDVDPSWGESLSPLDAACLRIEDRTSLIVNAGAMMLGAPLDFARLKRLLLDRFLVHRRFRQRVVPSGLPLGLPRWEDDPLFDLAAHLHRLALPAPGDDTVLAELLSDLISTPLDLSRPPWQVHLIEGHKNGCVVLFRIHHCIADGLALLTVLRSLADRGDEVSRIAPQPCRVSARAADSRPDAVHAVLAEAEALLHQAVTLLFHPGEGRELAASAGDAASTLGRLLMLGPDASTPYKGPLGIAKRVAWSRPVPVQRLKAMGQAHGATVQEVILGAVAGALRRDLQFRGVAVADLTFRVSIPVSMRRGEAAALGNRFSLNLLELPVDRGDPRERLEVLRERLRGLQDSHQTEVMYGLMNLFGLLRPELGDRAASLLNRKVTAVLSVVPGLPRPMSFAGQPVQRMMFWVPQSGRLGLGLSVLTYAGSATLGVACDAGLIPDPEQIVAAFHAELDQQDGQHQAAAALPKGEEAPRKPKGKKNKPKSGKHT